jgi:hypothetical protein
LHKPIERAALGLTINQLHRNPAPQLRMQAHTASR